MLPERNPIFPEGINASQENPLKEFALLLVAIAALLALLIAILGLAARLLTPMIPFSWERSLADRVIAPAVSGVAGDTPYQLAQTAIIELGQKLAPDAELADDISVQFHLIEAGMPNAFATLGGHIFVTSSLLSKVQSENGLAMVLAHEIAHIRYRHPITGLSRGVVIQLAFSLLGFGQNNTALHNLIGPSGLLAQLSYSREMEREADLLAKQIMLDRYGHLQGADELFRAMLETGSEPQWLAFFQSHPDLDSRIAELEEDEFSEEGANLLPLDSRILTYVSESER